MVINPIVGVYIPIIRIPIKGGMTIPNTATFDHGACNDTIATFDHGTRFEEPEYSFFWHSICDVAIINDVDKWGTLWRISSRPLTDLVVQPTAKTHELNPKNPMSMKLHEWHRLPGAEAPMKLHEWHRLPGATGCPVQKLRWSSTRSNSDTYCWPNLDWQSDAFGCSTSHRCVDFTRWPWCCVEGRETPQAIAGVMENCWEVGWCFIRESILPNPRLFNYLVRICVVNPLPLGGPNTDPHKVWLEDFGRLGKDSNELKMKHLLATNGVISTINGLLNV